MPSKSLRFWTQERARALDEIEQAHRRVGGSGRGRRYETQQINHAYAVLLSAHFQGFCRELHDESADHLVQSTTPAELWETFKQALVWNRRMDVGNPNPANIGSDFNRFRMRFWEEVRSSDALTEIRFRRLEELNRWRNAIAHQDFHRLILGQGFLRLERVRGWRSACDGLAISFDQVMGAYLQSLTGIAPWRSDGGS